MCSIFGVYLREELDDKKASKISKSFVDSSDRGRDSWGVYAIRENGEVEVLKGTGTPDYDIVKDFLIRMKPKMIIGNNRAEPTTEYVPNKSPKDIQPFQYNDWIVSHNGVVANDKELIQKYGLILDTNVDSAVLPRIFSRIGSYEGVSKFLSEEFRGSHAMVFTNVRRGELCVSVDYKPAYIHNDFENNYLVITSLERYYPREVYSKVNTTYVEPYTMYCFSQDSFTKYNLLRTAEQMKVLMIASGGLDSTVATAKLLNEGHKVTLLHFNYHHKAEGPELTAVKKISEYYNLELITMDTSSMFKVIGGTNLLKGSKIPIAKDRGGIVGAEYAYEWVPARNLVFISVAVALAEANGFDAVGTGINLEESGAYPDNEMEFNILLDRVLPLATEPRRRIRLLMPVGNLMKHEIVKLGYELKVPFELTWSCYEGRKKHCGRCGPCFMRKKAFEINGLKDPVMQ